MLPTMFAFSELASVPRYRNSALVFSGLRGGGGGGGGGRLASEAGVFGGKRRMLSDLGNLVKWVWRRWRSKAATMAMRAAERRKREIPMAMNLREMGLEEEGLSVRMREETLAGKVGRESVEDGGGGGGDG